MILTCPQCETRYLLSAVILGAAGRRVKCSNCQEIWHQDPDPNELAQFAPAEDEDQSPEDEAQELSQEQQVPEPDKTKISDIPEGVKPTSEDNDVPEVSAGDGNERRRVIGGFAAAGAVFVLIFLTLYFSHKSVLASWPESAGFYSMLGIKADIPGEGLVFDRVTVATEKKGDLETIKLEGHIINLTNRDQGVPIIEVSLKDGHGNVLKKSVIPASDEKLKAEDTVPFSSVQEIKEGRAASVYMRFVLKTPKDAEVEHKAEEEHAEPVKPAEHEEPAHH